MGSQRQKLLQRSKEYIFTKMKYSVNLVKRQSPSNAGRLPVNTTFFTILSLTLTHSLSLMQTISKSLAYSLFFFNAHSSLTHTPPLTVSNKLHFSSLLFSSLLF